MDEEHTDHDTSKPSTDSTLCCSRDELAGHAAAHHASVIVIGGWEIGREFVLNSFPCILGRAPNAAVFVNSPSVSRRHAQIDRVEDNGAEVFTVSDLGSSNGTQVNGVTIAAHVLKNGDRVRMGDVVLKFVLKDDVEVKFHHEVHRLIHFDQLTGLLTMETFRRRMEAHIREAGPGEVFCLAMTDLDGLKKVNDTYGHLAGRMVVREMGAMMRQALRVEDIAGLYGGDEAIVLFPGLALPEAMIVAERLRRTIEERVFDFQQNVFQVSISQGLAEWPCHGTSVEALISAADKALYEAKKAGRNCVRCAPSHLSEVTES